MPIKISQKGFNNQLSVLYDRDKQNEIERRIIKEEIELSKNNFDADLTIDTNEVKASLNREYLKTNSLRFIFKKDSPFFFKNSGPTILPGWHIDGDLQGKWNLRSDNIITLTLGNSKTCYPFLYKVLMLNDKKLILGLTIEGTNDIYQQIEFIK